MNKTSIFRNRRALRVDTRRKASAPPGGGGHENPGNTGDNTGVNSGDTGNTGESGDNTGDDAELSAFWGGSPDGDGNNSDSSGGSVDSNSSGGTGEQTDAATELTNQLTNLNFGEMFDPAVVTEINEGNFTNFNQRMNQTLQNAVRQSLVMSVQVMRQYGERLTEQMRGEFSGTLEGRDDQAQLVKDFPAAANPMVAPIIQQVYSQALTNAKGNRVQAVAQTKKMIGLLSRNTGGDLGLNVAPQSENDSPPQPATNWMDELMGRP